MRYLIPLLLIFSTSTFSQSVHKFVKSGNQFTYQQDNGEIRTYGRAITCDVQSDTARIRIYVAIDTVIGIPRTDVIQVAGAIQTGSIYTRRLAIVSILPTGDYSCVTCLPVIVTNGDGTKSLANYVTPATLASNLATKLNVADTSAFLPPIRSAIPSISGLATTSSVTSAVAGKLNVADTGTFLPPLRNAIPSSASIAGKLNISDTSILARKQQVRDSIISKTVSVKTITDMRNLPVLNNMQVMTAGRVTQSDNQGGFYIWSDTSTAIEDATYFNVIKSNSSGTGAWIRIFQRARTYTQDNAVIEMNGLTKRLYLNGTTDANGEITVNLTEERTSNGTPIFNTIRFIDTWVPTGSATIANAIQSYQKVAPSTTGLKTVTYGFYKANALTLTLGLLYTPFTSIGAGTVVAFRIDGN